MLSAAAVRGIRMKLALWQTEGPSGRPAEAVDCLARTARAAAGAGADLLVCPELYLSGYNAPEAVARVAEPADGPAARRIAAICAAENLAIAYGYAERDPATDHLYNAAQLFGPNGASLLQYRKTHLYGPMERNVFKPGDRLGAPAALGTWRVGLLICYDIEFPETARALALQGADILLVPTALPHNVSYVPNLLIPARAAENTVFVAYCNRCGTENGLTYAGQSRVAGPDAAICAAAGSGEALLIATLDHGARAAAAAAAPYLQDRQPALYGWG